jgi:3-dehydroquinate dehydratase-2
MKGENMKIGVLNGPNLNLLGSREPEIYGAETLRDVEERLRRLAANAPVELDFFQSNSEGDLIDALHRLDEEGAAYCIFNPGGYTFTSVALLDAVAAVKMKVIEVHLSNLHAREAFRHTSRLAAACVGQISGFGPASYEMALFYILARQRLLS